MEGTSNLPHGQGHQGMLIAHCKTVAAATRPVGSCVLRLQDVPGLCVARTLGDQAIKEQGVIATPEAADMACALSTLLHDYLMRCIAAAIAYASVRDWSSFAESCPLTVSAKSERTGCKDGS